MKRHWSHWRPTCMYTTGYLTVPWKWKYIFALKEIINLSYWYHPYRQKLLLSQLLFLFNVTVISSPEPKAQVSYCRPFSSVNFLHFHLLLENAWLDFNQTWQESSLGVGDSMLFKSYVWPPWGPRGRAPKGQNHANFKHLLLQIQKENGEVI